MTLAACGGGGGTAVGPAPAPAPAPAQPMACGALAGMAIPASAIGLPTSGGTVTSATVVPASGTGAASVPEHCLVNASITAVDTAAPKIMMRVALPTIWNGKALMYGGGGFDGSIPNVVGNVPQGATDQPLPLARGYAVFASDSGHQANARGSLDGSFGFNDESLRNWGGEALKKTRDTAMFLIKSRYAEAAGKAYFAGGSTGGREAIQSIQRWPADWDGAIAWYPAWNQASAMLGGQAGSLQLAKPGAYPNQNKRLALFTAAMQACDGLDGVTDGLVSNQAACNASFDPATATLNGAPLRCAGGADTGDTCLSDAQIAALKAINAPVTFGFALASGETGYPGYNVWAADLGMTSASPVQPTVTFLNFGTSAPANPMPTTAPYISQQLEQVLKNIITRDGSFNPLTFDPTGPTPWASRWGDLSKMIDQSSDLSGFADRGGKLLLAHGVHDVLVSSRATADYYGRLVRKFGQPKADTFVRYYEVPGFGHAVSSQFNATWDSLTALERWVEQGTAPAAQVTRDTVGVPGRTRPMCDYPKWARYNGSGDVNAAASFTCVN
ncbi:tannase/feruloyl esterase family alpha/beta hydrolase [Ramlibacter sp. USB13]|uniref:Tannase/feruloyl esterase family alpha/beta hydrolase n=2 Tax=Ramlibacter cellulosilyticus TaxID=2764187 RepID=A0A923MT19_9BURK|nr:tannase/feruloyl esterase family alpha/beta hydrolase [Ramlibacter cellulosilyticus]